tara:strand:+ start:1601 stop:1822 length:222 start_codon:yes stop_codon:yes gene_type:complete
MNSKSVDKFLYLFREMMGAGAMGGAPTNNVGSGNIAGTAEAGDDPPVRKKKRRPTPVGRYGTRRTWRQNGGTN